MIMLTTNSLFSTDFMKMLPIFSTIVYYKYVCRGCKLSRQRLPDSLFIIFSIFTSCETSRLYKFFLPDVKHSTRFADRSVAEANIVRKVPSSWEVTSEGASALLRAARDADDAALDEIAVHVRKFGFGDMDVNMTDSSGRVSYRQLLVYNKKKKDSSYLAR